MATQRHVSNDTPVPAAGLSDRRHGQLAQLAAQLNGAPGVRAAAQLQAKADASPRVQALSAMVAPPVQRNRTGLPDSLKSGVESLSGVSMDNVSVHYNSAKPAQLNAHAYTQGTSIHVGPGQERHLPHEAWHVVQQAQGRVRATTQLKAGVPLNDDRGLEREADVMGARAATAGASGADAALTQTKAPGGTAPVQRRMGLELEFPIPVDGLGALSLEQQNLLGQPVDHGGRKALQGGASLDKTTTMTTGRGFVVRPDHTSRMEAAMNATPAQVIANNITEFIFDPPVEALYQVNEVLDSIFDAVTAIGTNTHGLTDRAQLAGNYYVGPINTNGAKPAGAGLDAYSMQINFGIETQKIPDLFVAYSQSTDLSDEYRRANTRPDQDPEEVAHSAQLYREALVNAANISAVLEEEFRKVVKSPTPLLGIRGILAVQALYLLMGNIPQKERFGGTVKNFTPLLAKSSLSWIADYSLTPEEKELYATHQRDLLTMLLHLTGRPSGAKLSDLLVVGRKGELTEVTIEKLLTPYLDGPFVVPGAGILPDSVGGTRSRHDRSVRKEDKLPYPEYLTAPQRKPTEEEIKKYGPEMARMLAPSSVEPTEHDLQKEAEDGKRRNRRRGGVFETRVSGGNFTRGAAKARAKEMFMRIAILHGLDDSDMMTSKGQTDRAKDELY